MTAGPQVPDAELARLRAWLKDSIRDQVEFSQTDQSRGIAVPPVQKPAAAGAPRVALVPWAELRAAGIGQLPLIDAIVRRRSVRSFSDSPLTLHELSFLLYATQGVRRATPGVVWRTVPSAGNRHALETYLYCRRVESIEEGIYRYLPLDHELVRGPLPDPAVAHGPLADRITHACRGQSFAGECAATFIWTTIPYRMEWRYAAAAYKVIALDAGHVCQNLYLACQAIGAGTCAIAAYDQQAMDALLGVDGVDEFTIYLAPVGKRQ
ncbi:MAG: SagB/ThcOx family dehydrogenase [Candidatus Eisenbacteria bacterium]